MFQNQQQLCIKSLRRSASLCSLTLNHSATYMWGDNDVILSTIVNAVMLEVYYAESATS